MNISYQRLCNQQIAGEKFEKPEEVVKWMGALQAQDYQQALWAIGLRTRSATRADIEQAIADRKIVQTWPMRGTIHFVSPEDVKWMLKHLTPRTLAGHNRRLEQLELDHGIIERCKKLIYEALKGCKRATRSSLMELLEQAGISTKNQRGYHILWHIAQTGLICFGPMEEKQQTFVLLDEWVPTSRELTAEEALVELAVRYFTSHGPATIHDFAWWAGLSMTHAKRGVGEAHSAHLLDKINEYDLWVGKDAASKSTYEKTDAFLLPGYDEYLLGYKDRSAVLEPIHAPLIVPGNNGVFMPTIVVEGQVAGTWKRTIKKNGIDITFDMFSNVRAMEEAIMIAVRRYCDFIGIPLSRVDFRTSD